MRRYGIALVKLACLSLLLVVFACNGDNGMTVTGPTPPASDGGGGSAAVGDVVRGGGLYDRWWTINRSSEPMGTHPAYPGSGQQSGSTTWRCKECHGWDYKGVDGAYGPGSSHFTGIIGIYGTTLNSQEMFDVIKNPDDVTVNGHDFGNIGLSDVDILDLVDFIENQLIDTNAFINPGAIFLGDEVDGGMLYNGSAFCLSCHGGNGTSINFGSSEDPEYVGTIASDNPWEFIHKVRMGQPGSNMTSLIDYGGTNQQAANIGRYAQMSLTDGTLIFQDGFESGDTVGWSAVVP